jgi:hypothetical protein
MAIRLITVANPIKPMPIIIVKINKSTEKNAGVFRPFIKTNTISIIIPKKESMHKTAAAILKIKRILS